MKYRLFCHQNIEENVDQPTQNQTMARIDRSASKCRSQWFLNQEIPKRRPAETLRWRIRWSDPLATDPCPYLWSYFFFKNSKMLSTTAQLLSSRELHFEFLPQEFLTLIIMLMFNMFFALVLCTNSNFLMGSIFYTASSTETSMDLVNKTIPRFDSLLHV